MRFYSGGVSWTELTEMPLDEFRYLIQESKEIAEAEKQEIERARNGK